jgi:hypothetical protein
LKNNIGFFTHEVEASEHRKFLILRTHYGEGDKGWAMEGRFWRLNSLIGKADNCRLDTNLKGEKAKIAHEIGIGLKDLDEFLFVLETESELIHNDGGVIWTEQTQEDLKRAMAARTKMRHFRDGSKIDPETPSNGNNSECNGNNSECNGYETHGAERSGKEKNSKSERSVGDISESGETTESSDAPLRRFSIDDLRKEIQDCPIPLTLSPPDLETVFSNFVAADLLAQELAPYLAYAAERSIRQSKNPKPNGYFRNVLVKWVDWIIAFRDDRPKPKTRAKTQAPAFPAPRPCDCGAKDFAWDGRDVARCKACGAIWEYDPELGEEQGWQKTRDGIVSETG